MWILPFTPPQCALLPSLPVPTLPILFSRINHSFHLVAAVDTISQSFFFLIAIQWRVIFKLSHQYGWCFVTVNVMLCLHVVKKEAVPRTVSRLEHPHRWYTLLNALACRPAWLFLMGVKNAMLTVAQVPLGEYNQRLGVICQVLQRLVLPSVSQEEIWGENFC